MRNAEASCWKVSSPSCPPWQRRSSSPSAWLDRSKAACSGTAASWKPGFLCAARPEEGFFLLWLAPLLLLFGIAFAGIAEVQRRSQSWIARQSRLDLCAIRLAEERKALFEGLTRQNQALAATVAGIYAARGASLAGPVGRAAGAISERVLLKMNHGLARLQEFRIRALQGRELALTCQESPYSREPLSCRQEPALRDLFLRKPTLFADVRGPLRFRREVGPLSELACQPAGYGQGAQATILLLEGDPRLLRSGFSDRYLR